MRVLLSGEGSSIKVEGLVIIKTNGRYSYKVPITLNGDKWQDELSDPDPFFPSCPHLHCIGKPYKLNVYTGEIYNMQTKKILRNEKIRKKELKELWKNELFLAFVRKKREEHDINYPTDVLPPIPTFERRSQSQLRKYRFIKIIKRRF